jgi:general stress protein 26
MPVSLADLREFMRRERYAVQASTSAAGKPQAAVVGIVVSDQFEVFFDTLATTRKAENLRGNQSIAFVIGSLSAGADCTVQLEGVADEPSGPELDRLLSLYFATFPDGRERQSWPGLIYVRVKPEWIRWSNFAAEPPEIVEFTASQLGA